MGSNTTTTQASNQPWAASQPGLKSVIGGAQSLQASGIGSAVNTGSMVTPWSKQSMQGMNNIEGMADRYSNLMGNSIPALHTYAGGYNIGQRNNPMIEQYASG